MSYGKVDEEALNKLREIVGSAHVYTQADVLETFYHDETPSGEVPDLKPHCEAVVKPADASQVSQILALANKNRIPITFRGQGTGLVFGAVPTHGGILLSFERMNKILEIDENNMVAVAESGVVLMNLREEVERRGLFYPADPGERTSSIGGNVNTNAGGMNGVKYGKTRDYVLGLEAILPSGEILNLGGKTVKRTTGYELMHLLIGSEGTLAAVTKVIVRLIKLPTQFMTLYIPFNKLQDGVKSVSDILLTRTPPTAIEWMERDVVLEAERYAGKKMPHNEAEAYLIIRLEGEKEDELYEFSQLIYDICMKNGAVDVLAATSKDDQNRIWDIRSVLYEGLQKKGILKLIDTVVPRSKIADFMQTAKDVSNKYGVRVLGLGHAGDGNIHLTLLKENLTDEEWAEKAPQVVEEIFRVAVSFGGTVSGEHGIGYVKRKYLPLAVSQEQIRLMREIKKVFDPNNILNPGKIF